MRQMKTTVADRRSSGGVGVPSIKRRILLAAAVLLAACCGEVRGEILGEIVRVGYPTSQGDVVRVGAWTPVVVDLALQNIGSFSGELRLRQFDRDGDVYIDSVLVNLTAGKRSPASLLAVYAGQRGIEQYSQL